MAERKTVGQLYDELRAARTKREFDAIVLYYRHAGRYSNEERDDVEAFAQGEVQKFSVNGETVKLGRYVPGFRTVVREKL